jgi:hypothetical protein
MNSDHSDTQARDKASSAFSKMFIIGTDVAAWLIFHPDDLFHRDDDPINWWAQDFAIRKEFSTGTLVAVSTGGDGGYKIRVTDGSRTPFSGWRVCAPLRNGGKASGFPKSMA